MTVDLTTSASQTLRPYQEAAVADALEWLDSSQPGDRILYSAPTGCHEATAPILLWGGRVKFAADIAVGDSLVGTFGRREVLRLHRGKQKMARVHPVKGESFVVNVGHVLTLQWISDDAPGGANKGDLVDVPVHEWLDWPKSRQHIAKLLRRPGEWDLAPRLLIHPYLLGVLLGDGCLTAGTVIIANSDPDVAEAVADLAPEHGVDFRRKDVGGKYRLYLPGSSERRSNPLLESLRTLGLWGCDAASKFIPQEYFTASTFKRLELLAGMLDTDGHLEGTGYDWISKSERMATQFTALCRSVGLAAYLRSKEAHCQTGAGGTYYRVSVSGDCSWIPCRGRKKAPERKQIKSVLRTGFSVELLPEDNYYGWEVDGDHRYLDASYTLHHNTGKGTVELAVLRALRAKGHDAMILTPSLDVLRGYLERCGATPEELAGGPDALADLGATIGVTTPIRARNREIKGTLAPPAIVIYDEVHHAISGNEVSGLLFAMGHQTRWLGYTATPFRGSPEGTVALEADWPELAEILTIPDALALGVWALPRISVVPLIDDDKVKVVAGQFQVKSTNKAVGSRIGDLARLVAEVTLPEECKACDQLDTCDQLVECDQRTSPPLDMPTAVAIPSREAGAQLVEALDGLEIDAALVHAGTPQPARKRIYEQAEACETVIVSVKVINEGVDFPWLGRILDSRPTLSPVAWLQYLGRITRPKDFEPEYICCCRNVERHAYLLGGAIPRGVVVEAQEAFPTPSKRAGQRQVGLEGLGKFKAIGLPARGGVTATMYILYSASEAGVVTEWCTIQDPCSDVAIHATRVNGAKAENGARAWGSWESCPAVPNLEGFATQTGYRMSVKQKAWWERAAARHGLDPSAKVTSRVFQALPVLKDLGAKL